MIAAIDQKARCAYLRYLEDLLEVTFGEAVSESLADQAFEYAALPEAQKIEHMTWRKELHSKLDAVIRAECPGVDPTCCDVLDETPRRTLR